MSPIDPRLLRIRRVPLQCGRIGPVTLKKGERFLKGPVPLLWLQAAAALPGKSLHAGVAVWYSAGLLRSNSVPLSNVAGLRFGLDRNAKYRALGWLESAGLITVERKLGRAPIVTLVTHQPDAKTPNDLSPGL